MPGADFHQKKGSLGFGCTVRLCWALLAKFRVSLTLS